jgi:hypothetical protein
VCTVSHHEIVTGVFSISGKKNFLLPAALEMGFGLLFKVDEVSAQRHVHDRVDKLGDIQDDAVSMLSEAVDRYGLSIEYPAPTKISSTPLATLPEQPESKGTKNAAKNSKDLIAGKGGAKGGQKGNSNSRGNEKSSQSVKDEHSEDESDRGTTAASFVKKKPSNKKKMRKYADQDEEDFELAMRALGLKKGGGKPDEEKSKKAKKAELKKRQDIVSSKLSSRTDYFVVLLTSHCAGGYITVERSLGYNFGTTVR